MKLISISRRARLTAVLFLTVCFLFSFATPAISSKNLSPPEKATWFVDMSRFSRSAHAGFSCEKCHLNMTPSNHPDIKSPGFVKVPAEYAFDYDVCRQCHKTAFERFEKGAHAAAKKSDQKKEVESASLSPPTCGSCHQSHYTPSKASRVETGLMMIETCKRCHPEQVRSYLNDFHGKRAVNLKDDVAAYCTDCHGAHANISLKDPKKALSACLRCHKKAGPAFAGYIVHATDSVSADSNNPKNKGAFWLFTIQAAATVVVVLSVLFFFGHGFLWVLREIHEKLRNR